MMKASKRMIVFLVVLPLVATGLFFGFLPLALKVSAMNGASLLGVILIAAAGGITYTKVLKE
jgi:uncharacterized protein YqfA (UPF0365 family)